MGWCRRPLPLPGRGQPAANKPGYQQPGRGPGTLVVVVPAVPATMATMSTYTWVHGSVVVDSDVRDMLYQLPIADWFEVVPASNYRPDQPAITWETVRDDRHRLSFDGSLFRNLGRYVPSSIVVASRIGVVTGTIVTATTDGVAAKTATTWTVDGRIRSGDTDCLSGPVMIGPVVERRWSDLSPHAHELGLGHEVTLIPDPARSLADCEQVEALPLREFRDWCSCGGWNQETGENYCRNGPARPAEPQE